MGIPIWDQLGHRPRGLEVLSMFAAMRGGNGVEMRQQKLAGAGS